MPKLFYILIIYHLFLCRSSSGTGTGTNTDTTNTNHITNNKNGMTSQNLTSYVNRDGDTNQQNQNPEEKVTLKITNCNILPDQVETPKVQPITNHGDNNDGEMCKLSLENMIDEKYQNLKNAEFNCTFKKDENCCDCKTESDCKQDDKNNDNNIGNGSIQQNDSNTGINNVMGNNHNGNSQGQNEIVDIQNKPKTETMQDKFEVKGVVSQKSDKPATGMNNNTIGGSISGNKGEPQGQQNESQNGTQNENPNQTNKNVINSSQNKILVI